MGNGVDVKGMRVGVSVAGADVGVRSNFVDDEHAASRPASEMPPASFRKSLRERPASFPLLAGGCISSLDILTCQGVLNGKSEPSISIEMVSFINRILPWPTVPSSVSVTCTDAATVCPPFPAMIEGQIFFKEDMGS